MLSEAGTPLSRYALPMMHAALRWTLPLVAILIVGPLAGWLTAALHAPDGSGATSLLLANSPMRGVVAGMGVMLLAGAMGLGAARLVSTHYGMFCAGVVIAWGAWGTATIDQIVRARPSLVAAAQTGATGGSATSLFVTLALEGALLAVPALVIAWGLVLLGRVPVTDPAHPHAPHHPPHHPEPRTIRDPAALMGLAASVVVGGVIAWIVAQETRKGQTFAAAALGGLGAAAAGRLVATRINAAVFVAGIAVLAILGPLSAIVMQGSSGKVLLAAQTGSLFRLARPLPLDWFAGAFIGVPLGLTWAGSMLEQQRHKEDASQAARRAAISR